MSELNFVDEEHKRLVDAKPLGGSVVQVLNEDGTHSLAFVRSEEDAWLLNWMENDSHPVWTVLDHPNFECLDTAGMVRFLKAVELLEGDLWPWASMVLEDGESLSARDVVLASVEHATLVYFEDLQRRDADCVYLATSTADLARYSRFLQRVLEACELYGITEWGEVV